MFKKEYMKKIGIAALKSKFKKDRVALTNNVSQKISIKQSEYKAADKDEYKRNTLKGYERLAKI